ncbi:MAG: nucleotidyltransferase domain-containing protein [Thermoplasmata archaeon]
MRFRNELDDLLGSPIRVRVLRILTRFPNRGFTGRELAKLCESSPSQTNAALHPLRDSGVAFREIAGRSHVWRLASEHVLRDVLVRMFQGEANSLQLLKGDIEVLLKPLPVKRAFLFGSVARGDERPASDVDLLVLVESKAAKEAVESALSRASPQFSLKYGNPLSPLVLDHSRTRHAAGPQLIHTALSEGVEIGR